MHRHSNELQQLASRTGRGDPSAAAALRHEFESQMVHIVRRTMRRGVGSSPLAQRILTEARRVSPGGWDDEPEDRERVVHQVVRRICDTMMDRLQPEVAGTWSARDTVCASA